MSRNQPSASPGMRPEMHSLSRSGIEVPANVGVCVAPAGDVNGDGYADVIVGADTYDIGQAEEGCAFVFLGSSTGLAAGSTAPTC